MQYLYILHIFDGLSSHCVHLFGIEDGSMVGTSDDFTIQNNAKKATTYRYIVDWLVQKSTTSTDEE